MSNIDYLSLDARSLRTFLTVLDTLSVSLAAERLDVTQSAVSHTLGKLRITLGDPLFVRSGRGIVATERARLLRDPVRDLLNDLRQLTTRQDFDPTASPLRFVIAANDFQRDLIFPTVSHEARQADVDLRLRFIPSGVPDAAILREGMCDVLVTPFPPPGQDILQRRLFQDRLACFHDASVAPPPTTWRDFLSRPLAEVRFSDRQRSLVALSDVDTSTLREPRVSVPNFSALVPFIKGSDMVAAELRLMSLGPLKGLDVAPLPIRTRAISMYLVWHHRDQNHPGHQWFRERVVDTVQKIFDRT
ncbi:MAG: LysR family transcriptional regulator [Pseudomonadota bacterium]